MKVLVLAGDGIGPEIVGEAEKVLNFVAEKHQLSLTTEHALIGGIAVDEKGEPLPAETLARAKAADAILLGSVGGPKYDSLPRNIRPEQGLLAIRKELNLFANLRPAQVFKELAHASSLKDELVAGLDIMIVRELTGDIYFGQPRGIEERNGERVGFNTMIYSESEIRRIAHVAFQAAQKRNKRLCSIDKMNVLEATQLWRDVVTEVAAEYPDVELSHLLVDNAAMQLVRAPKQFDVMLTGNIFGDILSDEASMLTGSIGMLPSASLDENNKGLYEPIHGSAPDIAGKDVANPLATILSVAMMFRYTFAKNEIADEIESAVKQVLSEGYRTRDIAQPGEEVVGCVAMGQAVLKALGA
ncbi:3-isopropylmalate dehydrogenase [Ignatzschineria cameli]|uniref:3-isopropylmalate dehydrogenase n=1 Tax=Ignatzschineria cameli TaxID=2182793 RepID=A0A2U2AT51_9GAMM|nr:3-isopropylmalate dehydrogenase [Ignatzschineria cameli]PWD87901.1 3-isopropylmalate dehydrogenase [Ignatzschineria cameli]PWD90469.1 3-isopropylmalate dehydrogenase [Ignatzschineria cameli]PWD92353.1 3-isopropylmalate dehydrogenase [Ignatzschineria cameli]PWD93146.1 3-isopropylmalate dehydrogenase [Ignatzschineria cameli]